MWHAAPIFLGCTIWYLSADLISGTIRKGVDAQRVFGIGGSSAYGRNHPLRYTRRIDGDSGLGASLGRYGELHRAPVYRDRACRSRPTIGQVFRQPSRVHRVAPIARSISVDVAANAVDAMQGDHVNATAKVVARQFRVATAYKPQMAVKLIGVDRAIGDHSCAKSMLRSEHIERSGGCDELDSGTGNQRHRAVVFVQDPAIACIRDQCRGGGRKHRAVDYWSDVLAE